MAVNAHERTHWLSAVLILVGIVATAALVRQWPAPARVRLAPDVRVLASRPLPTFAAPGSARVHSVSTAHVSATHVARVPQILAEAPAPASEVTHVAASTDEPQPAPLHVTEVETPAATMLASRPIAIAMNPPPVAATTPGTEAPEESLGIVELPATAVTRAVSVAGRSIRSGLRATSSALRAAF